ncbi:hypothetical protein HK407_07g11690 [Ordospora pajunii]|uniref:uncharacterized protein n=1 Tax=Ordospora pajunii TaxID=3039483 RepID=UPI00295281FF|nr:uncharacterized protein HK407_07g11690 [Ordospora pajunii]KAH9411178.1 hypothetical protein HK407_07g11690 [Ordospora pajunii]
MTNSDAIDDQKIIDEDEESHKLCVRRNNVKNLGKQLDEFYNSIAPTSAEIKCRRYVLKCLASAIESGIPNTKVVPFGSFSTELIIRSSDIDIGVLLLDPQMEMEPPNNYLVKIKSILSNHKIVEKRSIFHIWSSRVPIIKFRDSIFGFKVDISMNQSKGVKAARFMNDILQMYPQMKMFTIMLKYFLAQRNLSDASTGGLNSYSQFLLVMNFFVMKMDESGKVVFDDIGMLFLEFFEFYGYKFVNLPPQSDSLPLLRIFVKYESILSIEDPTDPGCDVAMACKKYVQIKSAFKRAFVFMSIAIEKEDHSKDILSIWFNKDKKEAYERERIDLLHSEIFRCRQ